MRELTKQQQRILGILAQGLPIKSYCTTPFYRSDYGLLAFGGYSQKILRT